MQIKKILQITTIIIFTCGFTCLGSAQPKYDTPPNVLPVSVNYLYGFIDMTGKIVISPQFDLAEPFCGGLARVGVGRWIPLKFSSQRFEGKFGYINKQGVYVWRPTD